MTQASVLRPWAAVHTRHVLGRFVLGVVLSAVLTCVAGVRMSASCVVDARDPFEHHFATSSTVFLGKAVRQQVVSTNAGPVDRSTVTTFEVETTWKGDASRSTLTITTCGGPVGDVTVDCNEGGYDFAVGRRYVVFANGNPLTTNGCVPTTDADKASTLLQWLGAKRPEA